MKLNAFDKTTVLVTGDTGFLGRELRSLLLKYGATVVGVSRTNDNYKNNNYIKVQADLTKTNLINEIPFKIDQVVHCAGYNGGISFNIKNSYDIFSTNTKMALNITEFCINKEVSRYIPIIASCGYPESHELLYPEHFCAYPPNDTVEGHAYAKRNLYLLAKLARKKLNYTAVCPTTIMGPGDNLDPDRSKVCMAIIKKLVDAKKGKLPYVDFWGTGDTYRDFIDVNDAAYGILMILKSPKLLFKHDIINMSFHHEIQIKNFVEIVADMINYTGLINWDTNKADGAKRKLVDNQDFVNLINKSHYIPTPFIKTISRTIEWYQNLAC